MKIRLIIYMLLIFCVLGCITQKKENCKYSKYINEYTKGDFESNAPPVNWNYLFFFEINNDSIIATSNIYLHEIYTEHYSGKFSSFHMFLCSLYDSTFIVPKAYLTNGILKKSVMFKKITRFNNVDLLELKKRFIIDSNYLNPKAKLSVEEVFNLLYRFFEGGYYVFESDYSGLYHIRKH